MIRQSFFIFLLICLAGFLILPNISLAVNDFDDIDLREVGKYLELSEKDTQNLLFTLKQVFTTDWIYRESSGFSTAEESLVPLVLRKIIRIQALNHLLIDAPIEITWGIVKGAVEMSRVFLDPYGVSVVLNKIEKETVKRAIEYGKSFLFQNEIRMTPGAIEYKYISQRGIEQKIIIQYILIYQPLDNGRGNVIIRFYSPQPIDPPKSEGAWGMTGTPHSVQGDLPPFTVEIKGFVEDYKWVGTPSMKIDFPPTVPDLGIRPLSWWEKYILKPVESTIKEVEIIITKVTGKSPGLTDIWEEIKSFISKITSFSPAAIFSPTPNPAPTPVPQIPLPPAPDLPPVTPTSTPKPEISLEELQEMLDDMAEKMDILAQKLAELTEAKKQQTEEEVEGIEDDEELEELEELEEKEEAEKKEGDICIVNINTASKEELQKIIGVGPVIGQRIIDARSFYSLNDLIRVSGIGEITLQKIINQDCAYVDEFYSGYAGAPSPSSQPALSEPTIFLSYPEENPVNKEIEVTLSASNLEDATYDVKISIESDGVLSRIYNEQENEWPSSFNYLTGVFSGTFLDERQFRLKIDEDKDDFRGGADIIARIREIGQTGYLAEFKDKINIIEPEAEEENGENGTESLSVVINEIAWMGTKANPANEWIEFYNNTEEEINLSGWQLSWSEDDVKISLFSTIPSRGYFLMVYGCININTASKEELQKLIGVGPVIGQRIIDARPFSSVDDLVRVSGIAEAKLADIKEQGLACVEIIENNLSEVEVDFMYIGDLNDSGTVLKLHDSQGILMDKVECRRNEQGECSGWFAGDNDIKQTMERIDSTALGTDSDNWANNNLITRNGKDADENKINGTPGAENSVSKTETIISDLPFDEFSEITLTYLGSPYIIGDNPYGSILVIPEEKTLDIEPGVILKFVATDVVGYGSRLEINGTLKAIGEEDKKIVFTIYKLSQGNFWCGLDFTPTSLNSKLEHILIEKASACGGGYYSYHYQNPIAHVIKVEQSSISLKNSILKDNYPLQGLRLLNSSSTIENVKFSDFDEEEFSVAVYINGGNSTIRNSFFEKNSYGIVMENSASSTIEENNFEENYYPIYTLDSAPILKSNKSENNSNVYNGILFSGSISQDFTWHKNDLSYMIGKPTNGWAIYVNYGTILTIEPGVKVEFGGGGSLEIEGTLLAGSNEGETVIFTGYADQTVWKRIYFTASSNDSILENVVVGQGGYNSAGQIYIEGTSIEFLNSTSSNSVSAGIYLENSSSTVQNSHFENNQIGMRIEGAEQIPQLINNTFTDNEEYDIYWPNGGENCEAMATSSLSLTIECGCCL